VAQAYSQRARIPIITTSPNTLDESTRKQLLGFKEAGQNNILVFGGEAAISPIVEAEMVDEGFVTHRIREVDRYGTSARVAVELYEHADTVVIVSGEGVDGLLNAQKAAFRTEAPILFVKNDGIPQSVNEALQLLETKEVILIPSGVSEKVKEELETVSKVKVFPQDSYVFSGTRGQRIFDITLGLVLGALLFLLLKRERKEKVPYNVLTEDEERIIKAIEEKGGEIGQDALYEKTGFSRPKISRVVSELVERDLLEKTQFKRTFKLKIKKELVKD
ncbi:MAG: cell wall-binding repeat-containing protein, partial [Candidatus Hydrothermarchaeales archaeon]